MPTATWSSAQGRRAAGAENHYFESEPDSATTRALRYQSSPELYVFLPSTQLPIRLRVNRIDTEQRGVTPDQNDQRLKTEYERAADVTM